MEKYASEDNTGESIGRIREHRLARRRSISCAVHWGIRLCHLPAIPARSAMLGSICSGMEVRTLLLIVAA